MDFKDLLGKIAPTVLSATLGPAAAPALALLGGILGTDPTPEKINEAVKSGQLTGDQITKLKELELKYQAEEKQLGFNYKDLEFKDRDSARNREIQTKDNTNKVLAYTVLSSFIAVVFATLAGYTHADTVLAGTLIGYLSAKAEQVLAYYFGSSSGSRAKTELLAKADAIKE